MDSKISELEDVAVDVVQKEAYREKRQKAVDSKAKWSNREIDVPKCVWLKYFKM